MDQKDLKFYEAPTSEAVELKMEGILCASKIEGVDEIDDLNGGNSNPGF